MGRKNMLNIIINLVENIISIIKSLFKWLLNCLDTLSIIFTYLSILILTVVLVKSSLEGLAVTSVVCSLSIFTLMRVNLAIRGGER